MPASMRKTQSDELWVTVTRQGHPLCGRRLRVWGQLHRRGQLVLVLVLPDGSKKQFLASWTDLGAEPGLRRADDGTGEVASGGGVLASVGDLLHVREVISQLVARVVEVPEQAARQSPAKEDDRAAYAAQSAAGPSSGTTNGSGQSTPGAVEVGGGGGSGPADRPGGPSNCLPRTHRPARATGGEAR